MLWAFECACKLINGTDDSKHTSLLCLWYECEDSQCSYCGSEWLLYSASIQTKAVDETWSSHHHCGSTQGCWQCWCCCWSCLPYPTPQERPDPCWQQSSCRRETGPIVQSGSLGLMMYPSAQWSPSPFHLKEGRRRKKNQHVEWNAAEIHSTREAFIRVCEKRTETDIDRDGQLRRMAVVQLGSLQQMWWLVREPVRWFGSLVAMKYTCGLDSSSRISERQNQPSNAPTHNPSHGDFGTCRHACVLISRWCVLIPQEQIKVGGWALWDG